MNPILPGYSVSDCDQSLPIVRQEEPEPYKSPPLSELLEGQTKRPMRSAAEALAGKPYEVVELHGPFIGEKPEVEPQKIVLPEPPVSTEPRRIWQDGDAEGFQEYLRRVDAALAYCSGIPTSMLELHASVRRSKEGK